MRSRAALLLSIVLGAIAAVMILTWARGRESELLQLSQMKDVLVATKDIPANTIIDEQLVQRRQVPSTYMQPGAIGDVEAVKGRVTSIPDSAGCADHQHLPAGLGPRGPGLRRATRPPRHHHRRQRRHRRRRPRAPGELRRHPRYLLVRPADDLSGRTARLRRRENRDAPAAAEPAGRGDREGTQTRSARAAALHDRRGSRRARTDGTGRSDRRHSSARSRP